MRNITVSLVALLLMFGLWGNVSAQTVGGCFDSYNSACRNSDTQIKCNAAPVTCEWNPGDGCVGKYQTTCGNLSTFDKCASLTRKFGTQTVRACEWIGPITKPPDGCADSNNSKCQVIKSANECRDVTSLCVWQDATGCQGRNESLCRGIATQDKCQSSTAACQWIGPATSGSESKPGPLVGASVESLKSLAEATTNKANFGSPIDFINRAIRLLMAFIGSISLVLYIYSGFLWMTASGNAEQAGKAKNIMLWTTLGVAMMLASYILATFLFKALGV